MSWEKGAVNVGCSTMQGKALSLLQELVTLERRW